MMKPLTFIPLILFFSCYNKSQNPKEGNTVSKIIVTDKFQKPTSLNENNEYVEVDSVDLDSLLQAVLKIANENKTKISFQGKIKTPESVNKKLFAIYQFGNLFSNSQKHLLIKRLFQGNSVNTDLYSDIYLLRDAKFINVVTDTSDIGYWQDSLFDINGDKFNDYIISSYSTSGCCPRDAQTAYLYNNQTGKFILESFFNPEFDYSNKIIYETNYGSSGVLSFYKYRWNGLEKIKLESLSPNKYTLDSFVKPYSFVKIIYPGEKKQILKDVPEEYKKLKLYEYFIAYQE